MDFEFDYTQITISEWDFHYKISNQVLCNLCIGLESLAHLCVL